MLIWIGLHWGQKFFVGLIVLLVVSSSVWVDTTPLFGAWWVEQQRLPATSWQIVGRRVRLPNWYHHLAGIINCWRYRPGRERLLWLACYLLAVSGLAWVWLLNWIMGQMISPRMGFRRFGWGERTALSNERMLEVQLLVQVSSSQVEVNQAVEESRGETILLIAERADPAARVEERSGYLSPPEGEVKKPPAVIEPKEVSLEAEMKKFYQSLSEKDKRRYAGLEALRRGHGGQSYMARLLGCDRKTVRKGSKELREMADDCGYEKRIRKPGGGRKRYDEIHPDIEVKFMDVLRNYTAGDPMKQELLWTNLTHREIEERLAEQHNLQVSETVIRQLLKKNNYRRRKAQKRETMKQQIEHRNEQFENIAALIVEYETAGNPRLSMDTKKKEYLGNFYRAGYLYTRQELHTYDHDFNSAAEGIIIPHSLYDLGKNSGYINLGTSKETSQFACDSFRNWWYNQGQYDYPQATSILVLCDGGGSNNARHYIFKEDLQQLVNEIGIEIRIAHYPPYCSKYNPIEHRLFPHVTRACQGVIFKNAPLVKELMEKTKTRTGLTVTVEIIDKVYQTGRKVADDFKENMPIIFDDYLPQWNYRAVPNGDVI